MRLWIMLFLSLFMLSSCATLRATMVTTMDVLSTPYHYIFDDEADDLDN